MNIAPTRIRLSRAKGFNLQEMSVKYNGLGAVKVDRTNRLWGNPFVVGKHGSIDECLASYRAYLTESELAYPEKFRYEVVKLFNKNLACWCKFESPCHADILLHFVKEQAK